MNETNLQRGGKIPIKVARTKFADYKAFQKKTGIEGQTEYVIFGRAELEAWIKNLPQDATQILVYLGIETGGLDVFFWPYDNLNKKVLTEDGAAEDGYNIGDRQPLAPYEEL